MTIQVQEFLLVALEMPMKIQTKPKIVIIPKRTMPMKIQTTPKITIIPKRTTTSVITSTVRIIQKVQIAL